MQWDWKKQRSYSYYFNLTLQNIFSRLEVFAVLRSVSADKFSIYSQLSNWLDFISKPFAKSTLPFEGFQKCKINIFPTVVDPNCSMYRFFKSTYCLKKFSIFLSSKGEQKSIERTLKFFEEVGIWKFSNIF
jgi:hypothetical protein